MTIPNSVTSIGDCAFSYCSSLTNITIPNSVTSIEGWAFRSCSSLTTITIDPNNNYFMNDEYGVLFDKNQTQLIQYPIGNTRTSYSIPNSVASIGYSAFRFCSKLTTVTIGNSVTSIGYDAFEDCSKLTNFYFYGTKEPSYGNGVFDGCSSLKTIYVPITYEDDDETKFCGFIFEIKKELIPI